MPVSGLPLNRSSGSAVYYSYHPTCFGNIAHMNRLQAFDHYCDAEERPLLLPLGVAFAASALFDFVEGLYHRLQQNLTRH